MVNESDKRLLWWVRGSVLFLFVALVGGAALGSSTETTETLRKRQEAERIEAEALELLKHRKAVEERALAILKERANKITRLVP